MELQLRKAEMVIYHTTAQVMQFEVGTMKMRQFSRRKWVYHAKSRKVLEALAEEKDASIRWDLPLCIESRHWTNTCARAARLMRIFLSPLLSEDKDCNDSLMIVQWFGAGSVKVSR
jgi:hypothetical protein